MTGHAALIARIWENLGEIERIVNRADMLSKKAHQTNDDGYWDGVALNLHGFYSGVERIFEDIGRSLDGGVPAGPDWHASLLTQMSAEIPGERPPIIQRQTRICLDEYRGFRHVVRNVYAFNFRPERLEELIDRLGPCHEAVTQDLEDFIKFLTALV